jgi:hypothetical protein
MLSGEGCQQLGWLRNLATSHNAFALEDVPDDQHKLARWIVWRWWKPYFGPFSKDILAHRRHRTFR